MSTSGNGYPVSTDRASIGVRPFTVAGVDFPGGMRADIAPIMTYVWEQFHLRVEPLVRGWCWGYAYRPVRGQTSGFSNHASGTAGDGNAPEHNIGADPRASFTAAEISAIHGIIRECSGVVRWGGSYAGRKDGMHFEVVASVAKVLEAVARLGMYQPGRRMLDIGMSGPDVAFVQRLVGAKADGDYGPATAAAVKTWQAAHRLDADGVIGPATWTALLDTGDDMPDVKEIAKAVMEYPIPSKVREGSSYSLARMVQEANWQDFQDSERDREEVIRDRAVAGALATLGQQQAALTDQVAALTELVTQLVAKPAP